ncbi:MAG TPA: M14 family zinc carboxypeptidase [Variovorax sp.]
MQPYPTPFEAGNGNQTTTWAQCIGFYERLAADFPEQLRFWEIGVSDNGVPLHAGAVTADGEFDRERLQAAGRPVFFNNNGIHPGEPEGIDACMALVRDFCIEPERLAALGSCVFLFIPVYNVDGCLQRNTTSRANQVGPESSGFRGNGRNLDLNRDFVKCDSLAAQAFNRFFAAWDPDVMVDTHTSNGADYHYTMTLIHTQADKLGGPLGAFLRDTMLDAIYGDMDRRGWPTTPYVHPVRETPDDGIAHMLDVARFSTGYAALNHTIGFMPETHMLKPFADRYAAMRALVESVLAFSVDHGAQIQALRRDARAQAGSRTRWPVHWQIDYTRPRTARFKGYRAVYRPSTLGNYLRLGYDRSQPWERDIACFERATADIEVDAPRAYLVPAAWREVAQRLQWNRVQVQTPAPGQTLQVRRWRIAAVKTRAVPYEGHMFHDEVSLQAEAGSYETRAGDLLVPLDQPRARYAVETLEPQAHDSFFRWGFFNSVLEKKERYSGYVFEDLASEMLQQEPALRERFAQWASQHPESLSDQGAVLDFIFTHGQRFAEPGWMTYPVLSVLNFS